MLLCRSSPSGSSASRPADLPNFASLRRTSPFRVYTASAESALSLKESHARNFPSRFRVRLSLNSPHKLTYIGTGEVKVVHKTFYCLLSFLPHLQILGNKPAGESAGFLLCQGNNPDKQTCLSPSDSAGAVNVRRSCVTGRSTPDDFGSRAWLDVLACFRK